MKKSYGIICFRKVKNNIEILLVKKSTTYNFCDFVLGNYRKFNDGHLMRLFDGMTYYEKSDILSLQFSILWHRIYHSIPDSTVSDKLARIHTVYLKKKRLFENVFLKDSGIRLKRLISQSTNCDTRWEFPRGRKEDNSFEQGLNTALREFKEETNTDLEKIKIEIQLGTYIETYIDAGATFQNIYYFATSIGIWEPSVKFNLNSNIGEIVDIRWLSLVNLQNMPIEKKYKRILMNTFKKVIKKWKNDI
jgi:8-oxo-dGTP pyrophosphatase MutT (NUDIX family)